MTLAARLADWARRMKRDAVALWFACRNPGAPWSAKLVCGIVVAYALSPIDLIPDFIPVLGYLDEVILLPALIWLAIRLMPASVMQAARGQAEQWLAERRGKPRSLAGAVLIVAIWLAVLALAGWWWWSR